MNTNSLSYIPLGGVGDVTKNLHVYEFQGQILIIDCGLGFADETMLGVDLLLPDISYLLQALKSGKKIVGMALTHGHEDHIGALPFILPQLPDFPIYSTPFATSLANRKLQEFGLVKKINSVNFGEEIVLSPFTIRFIRVTHSIPDTSHIFIKTPAGNLYHGSDYKFDENPFDGNVSDFASIQKAGEEGVLCLLTDCLGSERAGTTPSEFGMEKKFLEVMEKTPGKVIITTYSSHINRINQILWAAENANRKVCFIGRSLLQTVDVAKSTKRITMPQGLEVQKDDLDNIKPGSLVLLVAGSQGQENSALSRIVDDVHRDTRLEKGDSVIFSSDTIPGNEILVNSLIDEISKKGINVIYSGITHDFHVSGHASQDEMIKLLSLTKPKFIVPISGNFRHIASYKKMAIKTGFNESQIIFGSDGQELILSPEKISFGKKYPTNTIYVDEISGEEVEEYVLLDRQKLSTEGVVIILAEIDEDTKKLLEEPDIIARGFSDTDRNILRKIIGRPIRNVLAKNPNQIKNTIFTRKLIRDTAEREIFKKLHRKPLILPVVIEI